MYYFTLQDGDAVILVSEMYDIKAACENGIDTVKSNVERAEIKDETGE